MTCEGIYQLAFLQAVWAIGLAVLFAFIGNFSIEVYYVALYLGLLMFAEAVLPKDRSARPWRRVRWVLVVGYVGVLLVIFRRVVDLLTF